MKVLFENTDFTNRSGPNSFASKLSTAFSKLGHSTSQTEGEIVLCFIEAGRRFPWLKMVQRLDGIYFNLSQDFNSLNGNISRTYKESDGVVFQTEFNKELITRVFGEPKDSVVIRNGADTDLIASLKPSDNPILDSYENVWCCASVWRPHKRFDANVRYFLEHKGPKDCLVVAGEVENKIRSNDIFYAGSLNTDQILSLYLRSKYFIHLSWLDHCPNVVIDARACGCQIICSDSGGTKEIAGKGVILIEEDEWDFQPLYLYDPPVLDFSKRRVNEFDSVLSVNDAAKEYIAFLEKIKC